LFHGSEASCILRYRAYEPGDFAQLYAIEELSFDSPLRYTRAYVRRLLRAPHSTAWIAEEGGSMAGFAIADLKASTKSSAAYIHTIEVTPQRRGQGIGGELLRRVESSARDAGAGAIWLHVDTENSAAIRLYESHGYQVQRRAEDYYPRGRAAFVYRKSLESEAA
jgi:[ribosomal protein S18]-alanine N-acetyltransferase